MVAMSYYEAARKVRMQAEEKIPMPKEKLTKPLGSPGKARGQEIRRLLSATTRWQEKPKSRKRFFMTPPGCPGRGYQPATQRHGFSNSDSSTGGCSLSLESSEAGFQGPRFDP